MAKPEFLDALRAYAAEVAGCASAVDVPAEQAAQRDELRQLADQIVLEIDEPLRIGFVGEFSAGKSLLLGVLVGKPDLLPTSMEPTTGNVTELRFVPAAGGAAALAIEKVSVRFFSGADAAQLDREILAELRRNIVRARVADSELAEFDAQSATWTPRFRDWCARMAQRGDGELYKVIRELALLRDAVAVAPEWLGKTVTITLEQLRTILEIRYPDATSGLPAAPAPGTVKFTAAPAEAQLAAAFPLVARVLLDIALPAESWPVSSTLQNQGFTLLDFPGIGGGSTKVRDLFLTRRGLEDVHTILVLVNAGRAGGQIPDTFYSFLRDLDASAGDDSAAERLSARIVYCAGRFDEIRPPESLIEDPFDATRMTVDRLLNACRPLSALLQSGHQPGLSAMRAFASSVLAVSRLGLRDVPGELDLKAYRGAAEERAGHWQEIAEALVEDATGKDLAGCLLGYAADGGVSALRQLLDQHVREHGLALRIQKAQRRLDELDELKAALENGLRAGSRARDAVYAGPSMQAHEFLRDLRRRKNDLTKQTSQLRDPAQVWLAPRWSVRQDIAQQAADLVMSWPEWDEIFGCVRNAVVVPVTPAAAMYDEDWETAQEAVAPSTAGLPQRLGDFQDAFKRTCGELRDYARDQAVAGARRWLAERSAAAEARDLQRRASALLDSEVRARFADRPGLEHLPTAIERITRPEVSADRLAAIVQRGDSAIPGEPLFPLRAEQLTSWARESPADESARHFVRVVRLRSALIDSATDYAFGCLDTVHALIAAQLHRLYSELPTTQLPNSRQFAAAVLGDHRGQADELADPAAALAELRRPDQDSIFGG